MSKLSVSAATGNFWVPVLMFVKQAKGSCTSSVARTNTDKHLLDHSWKSDLYPVSSSGTRRTQRAESLLTLGLCRIKMIHLLSLLKGMHPAQCAEQNHKHTTVLFLHKKAHFSQICLNLCFSIRSTHVEHRDADQRGTIVAETGTWCPGCQSRPQWLTCLGSLLAMLELLCS